MFKTIGIAFGIIATIIGGSVGYGKIQAGQNANTEKIADVKIIVKENTEAIDKEENINIEQIVVLRELRRSAEKNTEALQLLIMELKR